MIHVEAVLLPTLDFLAGKAWRGTRDDQSGQFLLQPSKLAPGASPESMHESLVALYMHARRWAPGLDVPFFVPPVRIEFAGGLLGPSFSDVPVGNFQIDREGYASISITLDQVGDDEATLLILAHEACHHILSQSRLNQRDNIDLDEITTDLAMFICGFGELVLRGHSRLRIKHGEVRQTRTHLGYLSTLQYQQAFDHVLSLRTSQRLPGRFDLAAFFTEDPGRSLAKSKEGMGGTVDLACGEAMCKRAFRATLRRTGKPWPIQCPACGVFLYPVDVLKSAVASELEPQRAELRLPSDGRLVACTSDILLLLAKPIDASAPAPVDVSTLLAEMLDAPSPVADTSAPLKGVEPRIPLQNPEPPAPVKDAASQIPEPQLLSQGRDNPIDAGACAPLDVSAVLTEMLEIASPVLDAPACVKDAAPPVALQSPKPQVPLQGRAVVPLKRPEAPTRSTKKILVFTFLVVLGVVMAWIMASR